jgi:hypothetical protein
MIYPKRHYAATAMLSLASHPPPKTEYSVGFLLALVQLAPPTQFKVSDGSAHYLSRPYIGQFE